MNSYRHQYTRRIYLWLILTTLSLWHSDTQHWSFRQNQVQKYISSMFLITFPWKQMKVQLLLQLQVIALSTWCQTNLHPSTAWGDFIKANSFASASSISNSWLGVWNRIGSNWYIVPVYGKCCRVEPIGIVDDGPWAADDTSINWLPSLTVNFEVQNFNLSERQSRLLHVSARVDEWFFFL